MYRELSLARLSTLTVQTVIGERKAGMLKHAVPGDNVLHPCALQYTAETAGSKAHLK